ncbi:ribonuclease Y [Candidatus Beckwithbacteria bacterium CG10_big_fil_rev_8_21_14_0_10_34_10]|uniref:Ribonuclease Y n=1 Tax=Candidatus Beckwithbacteria bacterium CG10_big_fil_rev_8_21_14_0_10_34_10 TaxID=1974495 RepID=A0A2H0WA57_9BACT|nr:MAG: ribonuclease Y [Candidatus Beckwithbacteria bacterium CG10_big_fil_rev_8_21_14_0_10_34_10]
MSFIGSLKGIFKTPSSPQTDKTRVGKKVKSYPPQKKIVVSAKDIVRAEVRAKEIILEAKDEAFRIKTKASEEVRKLSEEAFKTKERIGQREAEIDRKTGALEEREKLLFEKNKGLDQNLSELEKIKKQQLAKLERAAGLTREEAKKLILKAVEKKSTSEIGKLIKEAEEKAKEEAGAKAKEILVEAMYRGATDYVSEYTVSTIKLKDEDMKGRIIGREGRNIRTFEKTTGVDVDLDEEGVIRISCFDPVRREIAKVALEKLLSDGRIQPARIEEVVEKTKEDIEIIIFKAGEDLCHNLKVYNLPRTAIEMLGRFKYRFSYGQSMISHTLEETKIGIALAQEVGADVNVVRLGCLLHDIGKVITDEEGSHVQLGVDFLRKHNMPKEILDCVSQHHEDEPFSSKESVLVYIADAISGSRPGARYEDYGEYVERLEKLESLAKSFKGVKEAYAIQAGREVRVIVDPDKLKEMAMIKLSADLRDKIKKEVVVPGQVRVTVIREKRIVEVVK